MDIGAVHELVERVAARPAGGDRASAMCAMSDLQKLRAWVDAQSIAVATDLAGCARRPDFDLADAGRTSTREAQTVLRRAAVVGEVPVFGDALEAGAITAGHVDAIGRALRSLDGAAREVLTGRAGELAAEAADLTVRAFRSLLDDAVETLQHDGGMSEFQRARRANSLRLWADAGSGRWRLAGELDAELGRNLNAVLDAAVARLFAEQVPEDCPRDPGLRSDWLRAMALAAVAGADPARTVQPGGLRAEVVTVLRCEDPANVTADVGMDLSIPKAVIADYLTNARIWPVVIDPDGRLVYAQGRLDLGRSTRLANRAQRRVLQAFHPTCAIEGCEVRFQRCEVHHLVPWEDGGSTELDNLVPVCVGHHSALHQQGWVLTLGPDRTLHVAYPNAPPGPVAA